MRSARVRCLASGLGRLSDSAHASQQVGAKGDARAGRAYRRGSSPWKVPDGVLNLRDTPLLVAVDPYGDTVFNRFQIEQQLPKESRTSGSTSRATTKLRCSMSSTDSPIWRANGSIAICGSSETDPGDDRRPDMPRRGREVPNLAGHEPIGWSWVRRCTCEVSIADHACGVPRAALS
jgi:hypothetical protein